MGVTGADTSFQKFRLLKKRVLQKDTVRRFSIFSWCFIMIRFLFLWTASRTSAIERGGNLGSFQVGKRISFRCGNVLHFL